MGDGDRPGLREEITELILGVSDVDYGQFPWAETPTIVDSIEGIDDLWIMEGAAERLVVASKEVLYEIRRRMATDVSEFGPIRLGDTLYRVGQKGRRRVIEGQDKMLLNWLGADLKTAVPATAVRITAVRAIAEKRGQKPETIEDTFYWWDADPDEPFELKREYGSRLPNYFATMKHGDRR